MIYVGNVADAIVAAMNSPKANGEVFIVKDAVDYSTADFYDAIGNAFGMQSPTFPCPVVFLKAMGLAGSLLKMVLRRPVPIDLEKVARLTESFRFSADKSKSVLGFSPRYSLQQGVQAMKEWHESLG